MSTIRKILENRMSQKDIKQGIGIANDKRYVGGNMTGATKAMDKLKPGLSDHPAVQKALRKANEETEQDTDDYKLDKRGRKHKAHKIIFNKGEEEMKEEKKTYKTFIEQHTLPLTEEQLDEIVSELQEVLGKDAKAGDWISDFVHSDNPKFAGKSKEKRKEMALAAYYAKQRNEEVENVDEKITIDGKGNRVDNSIKFQPHAAAAKTDDKFLAYLAQRKAERDKKEGEMKEELKGNQHKLDKNKNGKLDKHDFKLLRKEDLDEVDMPLNESYDPADYEASHEKSQFGGHRAKLTNKKTGKVSYLGATGYHKPEHAKGEAEAYRTSYNHSGKSHPGATYSHDKAISAYRKKAKEAGHISEAMWPGTPEYKKKFDTDRVTGAGARHDIKKTSTGVIATRRFSDNDTAEKPKDEPKRGRGRPKKDKFAEAVEFLIALDEETFDSLMEEGFDSFMEQFEQLDEISKATLGSYVKKASRDAVVKRKIGADFENMADKSRKPSSKSAATELADKWKAKSFKRSANINKAVDRLTK
jgi:hypothetical protein